MENKLLKDVKIVAFEGWFAGPQVTKTLAAFGAEVLKIESKSRVDPERDWGSYKDSIRGQERNGDFAQYNTGKLDVTIDLTKPKGMELIKKFIARADIVMDNFAGDSMTRMGLGYEVLKKIKPDIIMLGASIQGHTGPYVISRGLGWHLAFLSGFYQIVGWPDRDPDGMQTPYPDFIASRISLMSVMAALDYKRRTGKGQYIDISQYEGAVCFLAPLVLDYGINGRIATGMGNWSNYAAPHNAYQCRGVDRWCAVAVYKDEEWESFCKVIGNPVWTRDSKFASLRTRKENEDELDKLITDWTITKSAEEVMTLMQTAGVGAGVLETPEDILERDPQLKYRKLFVEVEHPDIGKYHAARPAFLLEKSSSDVRRAPLLGEHTEYALKELLGMSDDEVTELVIEGVIE